MRQLRGWFVQSVDLTERGPSLRQVDPTRAVFLGCRFSPDTTADLVRRGALVFPELPDVPFDPYRATVYTASELYDTSGYSDSLDARAYAWFRRARASPALPDTLAMTLHDHAITDALNEVQVDRRQVVGIMGGHALRRDDPAYLAAARLAATLTEQGWVVLTGGGPGAMEAGNLGARFAGRSQHLPDACAVLAGAPAFAPDIDAWADAAFAVLGRWQPDRAAVSLGVPTWHYGHEPPNPFASHIAKYFANALREDTLLQHCRGGIVCLPGAAGTVQEIFQATTENYYAIEGAPIPPLVLVGRAYWTERLPAWQLLTALGEGRAMAAALHLVGDLSEVPHRLGLPSH